MYTSLQLSRQHSNCWCFPILARILCFLQLNPRRIILCCLRWPSFLHKVIFASALITQGICDKSGPLGKGFYPLVKNISAKPCQLRLREHMGTRRVYTSGKIFKGLIFMGFFFVGLVFAHCTHHKNGIHMKYWPTRKCSIQKEKWIYHIAFTELVDTHPHPCLLSLNDQQINIFKLDQIASSSAMYYSVS